MAFFDTVWYANAGDQSTTGYYAVAKRPQNTAVVAGQLVRQFTAPAVNFERVFVCTIAGTTANTTDATWTTTRGGKTVDGTATFIECTGNAAVNGDAVNTQTWAQLKAAGVPSAGLIIKRNNGASYHIVSNTPGAIGASEPAFSDVAGSVVTDSATQWTCLGPVTNFTGGQAPHARLANACANTWFAAGNTVYVGDNHAESQATAITLTATGTAPTIGKVIGHNHSGSYPPASMDLMAGASISTTAAVNTTLSLTGGSFYLYGLTFKSGVGASSGASNFLNSGNAGHQLYFDNCSFWLSNTLANNTSQVQLTQASANGGNVIFNNCTVKFAVATQILAPGYGKFIWQNTGPILASGSVVPNSLFVLGIAVVSQSCSIVLEAIDLSQITTSICSHSSASQQDDIVIKDCKLNASLTISQPTTPTVLIQLVRSDSAATAYKSARYTYEGTETTETSITRVGGATDPTGQAQSRKIVTTANAQWLRPFKAEPYAIWNAVTGTNVTVTVCGTVNAGALPNNDDIWLETEYISDSSFPLGKIVTSTKANLLTANAAVAADGSSWINLPNTTLNPSDKESHITLSNGNLTATGTGGWVGFVRAVQEKTSGKFYWEYTFNATQNNSGVGVSINSVVVGSNAGFGTISTGHSGVDRVGSVRVDGGTSIIVGGSSTGISFGIISSGAVICVAIDVAAKLIWFRLGAGGNWNNNASRDPATGAGGVSLPNVGTPYPTLALGGADTIIANFGDTAFTGAVPSGFTSGWPSVWAPFKLAATLSSPQPTMAGYIHARVRAAKASTTYYIDPQITLS